MQEQEGSGQRPEFPQKEYNLDPVRVERIAKTIMESLNFKPGDRLFVNYHQGAAPFALELEKLAKQMRGDESAENVKLLLEDPAEIAKVLTEASEEKRPEVINGLINNENGPRDHVEWATHVIRLVMEEPYYENVDPEALNKYLTKYREDIVPLVSNRRWMKVAFPSIYDAQQEGMPYSEFAEINYKAYDRDWEKIRKAQDILIDKLKNGKTLTFRAGRRPDNTYETELTMSIEGQTFANETIESNLPGSEVFTGPVRYTVDGTMVMPYPVMVDDMKIPNITLTFKEGKVISFNVDSTDPKYKNHVKKTLETDDGAIEVGEVGIGTNRAITKPLISRLLTEKIGGSFHIALGYSYKFEKYAGKAVKVYNGVESKIHIDFTCLMLPEFGGGEILIDDEIIQLDGEFKIPGLEILNSTD